VWMKLGMYWIRYTLTLFPVNFTIYLFCKIRQKAKNVLKTSLTVVKVFFHNNIFAA